MPTRLEDLDAGTLAQVQRRATDRGVTPDAYLASAIAEQTDDRTAHAEAAVIVAGIRRLRSGVV